MIYAPVLLTSCLKILLIPAYHSTDFEVHRNWLAITYNLPVSKWYFEDSSEWTLDYPPLFAWFEYLLSFFAPLFDRQMLKLENHYYASNATVVFQRLSVIVTDLVYAYGVHKCSEPFQKTWRSVVVLPILLLTNAGLLMVDHIHFQYNGIMYGILLISIANILQNKFLGAAFWFTVLINMKHIYMYMAPAYFIYLLCNYCFQFKSRKLIESFNVRNTAYLGVVVLGVFVATFLPFHDHIGQVLSRMFPFKRGLCHAYWAPNIWAFYNVIDKAAAFVGRIAGFNVDKPLAAMTGGLVQEFSYAVLPTVSPLATTVLTVLAILPAMIKLGTLGINGLNFIRCLVICVLSSFMLGWHVHEKAILMAIIPLSILCVFEAGDAKVFLVLSTVGHYSLFPLLFPSSLLFIKAIIHILYTTYAFYSLHSLYPLHMCKCTLPLLNLFESIYLLGLVPLFAYENFIHSFLPLSAALPFLPLMLTSVYCAIGVFYCWIKYYIYFMRKCGSNVKTKSIKVK